MDAQPCALCGEPIDVGSAWMAAEEEGPGLAAHAGCVYRDEEQASSGRWAPRDEAWTAGA